MTENNRSARQRPYRSSAKTTDDFWEEVRAFMRVRRYSLRSEESYLFYIRAFILFHRRRPEDMRESEVEAFLTDLVLIPSVGSVNAIIFWKIRFSGF
jgi:hypothetical protein